VSRISIEAKKLSSFLGVAMADLRFEGSVHPAGLELTIRKHQPVEVWDADLDYAMRFDLQIVDGNVIIDCLVDNYDFAKHHIRLYMRASDLANAAVNLAAFAMGVGATVVLHSSVDSSGTRRAIVMRDRNLQALCTAFSPDDDSFDQIMAIIHADLRISRAIRDLTEAISGPHLIPSMCARSIETLRVLTVPEGVERKKGWELMRDS
jgi:hypothetical protein